MKPEDVDEDTRGALAEMASWFILQIKSPPRAKHIAEQHQCVANLHFLPRRFGKQATAQELHALLLDLGLDWEVICKIASEYVEAGREFKRQIQAQGDGVR